MDFFPDKNASLQYRLSPAFAHITARLLKLLDVTMILPAQVFLLPSQVIGLPLHPLVIVIGIFVSGGRIVMTILALFPIERIRIANGNIGIGRCSTGKGTNTHCAQQKRS